MTSSNPQPDRTAPDPEQPSGTVERDESVQVRQAPPPALSPPRPGTPPQPQPETIAPPTPAPPVPAATRTGQTPVSSPSDEAFIQRPTPAAPAVASAGPQVPSDDLTALISATQADVEASNAVDEAVADDAVAENGLAGAATDSEIADVKQPGAASAPVETVSIPLTGAAPELADTETGWRLHESGRWVVGDPGRQLDILATASRIVQTRPDLSVDWAEAGALAFRAASIRGLGHFADGKPRQDACGVAFAPNNRWLVGCVADGVSAAKHAHQAADIAAATFTNKIGIDVAQIDTITDPETWPAVASAIGWQAAVDEVSREITAAAEAWFRRGYERVGDQENLARLDADGLLNNDARQVMATTAVVFAVATEPLPDRRVPFAVVVAAGDSEAMILSEGVWHPISAVKNEGAEIASSAVSPLPRTTAVEPIVGFLAPGQALAVITDGIGDPLGSGTGVVGRFLATRWATVPDPIAFANDISFYRKSFVDDRTAVLVWVKD